MRKGLITERNPFGLEEGDDAIIISCSEVSHSDYSNYINQSGRIRLSSNRIAQFHLHHPMSHLPSTLVVSLIDLVPFEGKNNVYISLLKDREGKVSE